jgi:nucleotide-binding universal stress UspA family protein
MNDAINPLEVPPIDRPDWPRREPGTYPILVGVQFDETGANALRYALALADSQARAEIHVAHVITDGERSSRTSVVDRHLKELEEGPANLRAFVADHVDDTVRTIKYHVRMGDASETLLQLALDYDAEVVVVGTHGRKGIKKLMFGSVAQKLVEAARCPVLIAAPRDFSGMDKTRIPDPVCPDCESARAESEGALLWCAFHARPHVRPHAVAGGSGGVGGHDPSIVPPSGS